MPQPGKVAVKVREPRRATLRRYGLTVEEWRRILRRQGGVCSLCGKVPANGMLNIDHEHVKRWKKLPPAERKKAVRGLVCPFDNHYVVGRYMTVARATAVLAYLKAHERRRR